MREERASVARLAEMYRRRIGDFEMADRIREWVDAVESGNLLAEGMATLRLLEAEWGRRLGTLEGW